ncbi:MAG: hypothetical protein EA376_11245 [Phycisphaeraceae bacterium]|nr:MAG: hypothetical protein EA376_11245 [Phycisphaeraceae bacterium]
MSGINELGREAWTPWLALAFRVGVAATCGAALAWGLWAGWSGPASWWHWGVVGASAAAILAVFPRVLLTPRSPQGLILNGLVFGLGVACIILLGVCFSYDNLTASLRVTVQLPAVVWIVLAVYLLAESLMSGYRRYLVERRILEIEQ